MVLLLLILLELAHFLNIFVNIACNPCSQTLIPAQFFRLIF